MVGGAVKGPARGAIAGMVFYAEGCRRPIPMLGTRMSLASTSPPGFVADAAPVATLADLMERIGNVPLARVRMQPSLGGAVEQDVLAAAESGRLCELVEGVLVEKATGFSESVLAAYLIEMLNGFVRATNLGPVTAPDGTYRLFPGLVRIPEAAFTSWDHIPNRRRPTAAIPQFAPDLAVEVLSASNTSDEMARKRRDHFAAGVRLVWIADPENRTVDIYSSVSEYARLGEGDEITGAPILPGFTLKVSEWFAELDRRG
jgi:Uma2 family endonuclease